jgi:hypothetical protein
MIRPSTSRANGSVEILLSAEATYDIEAHGTSIVIHVSPMAPRPWPSLPSPLRRSKRRGRNLRLLLPRRRRRSARPGA